LRARLRTASGSANLRIDPRCIRLIDDLRTAVWPSALDAQHALAWLRYFVDREYPVRRPRPTMRSGVGFSTSSPP